MNPPDLIGLLDGSITAINAAASVLLAVVCWHALASYRRGEPFLGSHARSAIRMYLTIAIFSVIGNVHWFILYDLGFGEVEPIHELFWGVIEAAWTINTIYFFGLLLMRRAEVHDTSVCIRRGDNKATESSADELIAVKRRRRSDQ